MAKKPASTRDDRMEKAFFAVTKDNLSIRRAADRYSVDHVSLSRRVNGKVPLKCKPGPSTFLTQREEELLLEYVFDMADRGFGLTVTDVRELAVRVVAKSGRKSPFSGDKAGWDWYKGFKARHPQLVLRKAEPMSAQRMNNSTPEVIKDYFEKLAAVLVRLDLMNKPMQIFNADESGITCVHKPGKILTQMGKRAVFSKVSAERGTSTTILVAGSAAGLVVPPMMIFKGKRLTKDLTKDGVPGTFFSVSDNGWSDRDLFFEWIKFFISNIPPARPVLLLLDGHESHMSLEALRFALANDVHLLCLPSHTTHLLQPLDVAVFGPFKKALDGMCAKFMRTNPQARITRYDLSGILKNAWYEAMKPSNFLAGFRTTGIQPLDPGKVLDRLDLPDKKTESSESTESDAQSIYKNTPTSLRLKPLFVLPEVQTKSTKSSSRSLTSSSQCLTSDDFIQKLEDREERRSVKEKGKKCTIPQAQKSKQTSKKKAKSNSEEDYPCTGCGIKFGISEDVWIQCDYCHEWQCAECAEISAEAIPSTFMCFTCSSY